MTETTEVQPIDVEAERDLCRRRDSPINWATYEQALDEIVRLRTDVDYRIRAARLRAGYKPEGKSL